MDKYTDLYILRSDNNYVIFMHDCRIRSLTPSKSCYTSIPRSERTEWFPLWRILFLRRWPFKNVCKIIVELLSNRMFIQNWRFVLDNHGCAFIISLALRWSIVYIPTLWVLSQTKFHWYRIVRYYYWLCEINENWLFWDALLQTRMRIKFEFISSSPCGIPFVFFNRRDICKLSRMQIER